MVNVQEYKFNRHNHDNLLPDLNIGGLHMMSSKHDYANYDQFAPNFVIAYKTIQHVSVPNLSFIWINENRVTGQRSWKIFYYVHIFAE